MVSSGTMFPLASSYWSKTDGHDSNSFVAMRNKIGDQHSVLWNCASPIVWRKLMGLEQASKNGIIDRLDSWSENVEWQDGYNENTDNPLNVYGADEALLNYHLSRFDRKSLVYIQNKDNVCMSSLTSDSNFLVSIISDKITDKIVVNHDEFKYHDIVVLTPDNDLHRSSDYHTIMSDLLNGWITTKAMYKHIEKARSPTVGKPLKLSVDNKIKPNVFS